MKEDIERLKRIYNDLKQQCDDKSCPIMILAEIDAEDLDFMREHMKTICWAYEGGHGVWQDSLDLPHHGLCL